MAESTESKSEKNPISEPLIAGIFAVIVALIGGYFLLVSTGHLPNPFRNENQKLIDAVAGVWSGTAKNGDFSMDVTVTVTQSCEIGATCGSINIPTIPCSATFTLLDIHNKTLDLLATNKQGACGQADSDTLELLSGDTLLYTSKGEYGVTQGTLQRVK